MLTKAKKFLQRFRDQRPQNAANEALERAAQHCDRLAALYPREDVGFDTGFRMAALRAARNIRNMKG